MKTQEHIDNKKNKSYIYTVVTGKQFKLDHLTKHIKYKIRRNYGIFL